MRPLPLALAAFVLAALLASPARADVIHLKDGTKLEGQITAERADEIELRVAFGSMTVKRDHIAKIVQAEAPETAFRRRLADLADTDADGRAALAREALTKLYQRAFAAELAAEAWRLAPGHEAAGALLRELEYVLDGAVWVPPERWYPAHDYVRREKRWIWREEATHQDAKVLTAKARQALAVAEAAVLEAEAAIPRAIAEQGRARGDARALEGGMARLQAEVDRAEAALATAEAELRAAQEEAVLAQARYAREARPTSGTTVGVPSSATTAWVQAVAVREARARQACEAARADLERRRTERANAEAALGEARAREERAVADERIARERLPLRQRDAATARAAHERARNDEAWALEAVDRRRERERQEKAEREKAERAERERAEAERREREARERKAF